MACGAGGRGCSLNFAGAARTVTDAQGQFTIAASPGAYRLSAEAKGFRPGGEEITIEAGGIAQVDLTLRPGRAQLRQH